MKQELVQNWMSQDITVIPPQTPLTEIHALMFHEHIRHLPVMADNRLIGIVSKGDMRSAVSWSLFGEQEGMLSLNAEEIMTPDPVTIPATATIGEAASLMLKRKISGLPVVNEQRHIIGIITEADIFRMIVKA
ncbi:CBS domain-containing protein, partial [Anaerolineales bacterium HSG6]|nr:CBS domain-containing protein [Anaerolineales bacterium HSG6]